MKHAAIGAVVLAAQVSVFVPPVLSAEALEDWHRRDWPAQGGTLLGVAYGGGLFTAVGENGTVITSPDGVTWTQQPCPTTYALEHVVYGNGLFLAAGSPQTLLVSSNGADWLSTPVPTAETLEGIAFAGGYFFAFTSGEMLLHIFLGFPLSGPAPGVFTSATGTNWTTVYLPETAGPVFDVAYGQGQYVAVGVRPEMLDEPQYWGFGGWGPVSLLTSPDAVTWNDPLLEQCPLGCWCPGRSFDYFPLRSVAYGLGRFVALGDNGGCCVFFSDSTNCVVTSTPKLRSVAFGDGLFVGVGDLGALVTSTHGNYWTVRDCGQGLSSLLDVTYGRNTFVAVGGGGLILQSDPILALSLRQIAPGSLAGGESNGQGSQTELTISGPAGGTCQIQSAGEIALSNGWQTVATVTLSNAPTIWVDPQSVGTSPRFYRAVLYPQLAVSDDFNRPDTTEPGLGIPSVGAAWELRRCGFLLPPTYGHISGGRFVTSVAGGAATCYAVQRLSVTPYLVTGIARWDADIGTGGEGTFVMAAGRFTDGNFVHLRCRRDGVSLDVFQAHVLIPLTSQSYSALALGVPHSFSLYLWPIAGHVLVLVNGAPVLSTTHTLLSSLAGPEVFWEHCYMDADSKARLSICQVTAYIDAVALTGSSPTGIFTPTLPTNTAPTRPKRSFDP
jgi:hypothetical protein